MAGQRLLCLLFLINAIVCSPTGTYDTIVVGMGAAGTGAASTLARAGRRVLALEAQPRIGGRVYTVPFGDGVVEVGAEWIHGTGNSRVYELAVQNNLTVLSQSVGYEVFRSDGNEANKTFIDELLRRAFEGKASPPEKPEPMGQYMTRILRGHVKSNHPDIDEYSDYFDDFLSMLDLFVDNYEASDDWNQVSTGGQFRDLDGDQNMSWHRLGYRTVFELLLNTYNNGPGLPNLDIKLNTEVSNIAWNSSSGVSVTCADGTAYTANNVIVTPSLGVLKAKQKSLFTPELPAEKTDAINQISFGILSKVILTFEHLDWMKHDSYLFIWNTKDREELSADKKWYTLSDGLSVPMGCRNCLTMWFNGDAARLIETLPEEELKSDVMQIIRTFMGKKYNITDPVDMIRSTWYTNPYTRGSYTFDNLETPNHPNARSILAAPLLDADSKPRVLFAGEATNSIHFATVHGALETGYREAARLMGTE